ncbi:MAG TPA: hypothetical protein VFP98_03640 [Candidatus Polarisedimenticolia bacterium]|nr:hypothetical protein [Candidatus Polarisedimenticolia bacterium]
MTALSARVRSASLAAAAAGLALSLVGALLAPARFFQAYLFAFNLWLGVSLGCLAILMIQYVTGGAWGIVIRRILEAGARNIPYMALLFLPLLAGLPSLYVWARPEVVAHDALLQHKQAYLNVPFFVTRAAIYFGVWTLLALVLHRWSRWQDESGDPAVARRFQSLSAGGLLAFVLTMTFASVDWVMSLEPHWFSTIYGVLLMAGQAVSALSFAILTLVLLSRHPPLSKVIEPRHLRDLGTLLFAFVMVWAYFALSQFLIIWSGNLPEEIPWYLKRLKGGWEWVGVGIILLHFALPFLLLLSTKAKRSPVRLVRIALLVFVMRAVDLYWMIKPAFEEGTVRFHWLDLAAPIGLGGVWIFLFARHLGSMPLLPARDPYLAEAVAQGDLHEA